jgi:hypothetical protein
MATYPANSNAEFLPPNFGRPSIGQKPGVLRKPAASVNGYESGDGHGLRAAEKLSHATLGNPGTHVEGRNAGSAVNTDG